MLMERLDAEYGPGKPFANCEDGLSDGAISEHQSNPSLANMLYLSASCCVDGPMLNLAHRIAISELNWAHMIKCS
jgi:hypothetical protein